MRRVPLSIISTTLAFLREDRFELELGCQTAANLQR